MENIFRNLFLLTAIFYLIIASMEKVIFFIEKRNIRLVMILIQQKRKNFSFFNEIASCFQ